MRRCRRLAAHLWAWGIETGWTALETAVYEEEPTPQERAAWFSPAGGGIGDYD